MSIAVSQTLTGSVTTGNTITLSSWSPSANDLILVAIASRMTSLNYLVSGNGLTFTLVKEVDNADGECQLKVFRAMGSAPSTGAIVVTTVGNTKPVVVVASRFSGCDTGGSGGSGAVEVIASDDGPSGSNDDMKVSLTTISTNAMAWAAGTHRNTTFTVPGGETSISANNSAGTSSDTTTCSTWYEATTAPLTTTLGADNDLSGANDWVIIALSLKPGVGSGSSTPVGGYKIFLDQRPRRLIFKNASGDYLTAAMGYAHPLDSNYQGSEVEGIDIRNTIRVLLGFDPRGRIVQGDYVWLNSVQRYLITSIKPFGSRTEIIAVVEISVRGAVPDVVKVIDLAAATAETIIWQPVNGKKFRLMEMELRIGSTTTACKLTFRDGSAGSTVLVGFPANNSDVYAPKLGVGILSEVADNPLTVERSVSDTLAGYLLGFEE